MEKKILGAILLIALIASTLSSCAVSGTSKSQKQPHGGSKTCSHEKTYGSTKSFNY
jgi:hypothetical protein